MVAYGSNLNMITDFHLIIIHFYTLQGLLIYCTTYIMIMSDKNSPHSIMTSQCFGSCPLSQPYMVMTNQTQTRQPSASVPCTALPYWLGMWLLTLAITAQMTFWMCYLSPCYLVHFYCFVMILIIKTSNWNYHCMKVWYQGHLLLDFGNFHPP